jgi:hypothetical protein
MYRAFRIDCVLLLQHLHHETDDIRLLSLKGSMRMDADSKVMFGISYYPSMNNAHSISRTEYSEGA